ADGSRYRAFDSDPSDGGLPYAGDGWGDRGYRGPANGYNGQPPARDRYSERYGDGGRDWRGSGSGERGAPARRPRSDDDETSGGGATGGTPSWRNRVRA